MAMNPKQPVQIILPDDFSALPAERQSAAIDALAAILGIAPLEMSVHDGRIDLSVPSTTTEHLRSLLQSNNARLRLLRVRVILEGKWGQPKEWAIKEGKYELVPPAPKPTPSIKPQKVHLFRPLVVGLMAGCIAWSLVKFVRLLAPGWNGTYLVLACVLAAVEAGYSSQLLRARRLFSEEILRFRAIELALFFILLKMGGYVGDSWPAVWAEIQTWPHDPLVILNLETVAAFILALTFWAAATATASDLARLGEPPERTRHYVPPLDSLTNRFFWGGGFMLVAAGLTLIGGADNWRSLIDVRRASFPGLALNVLLYFVLGLVVLGQARFTLLRQRWQAAEIPVDEALPGRWTRASLIFLGLAALLAFLLPTGFSVGFLELVGTALMWMMAIIGYIAGLLLFIIALLLSPLFALLFKSEGVERQPVRPPQLDLPLPPIQPAGVTPDWVLLMRSVLFWALILGGVLFVVRTYLRDHPELADAGARLRPFRALRSLWAALLRLFGRWKKAVQERLPHRPKRHPAGKETPRKPFRFFRLRALAPRERILYYYWSILRRAERLGLARRPSETPYEYDASLEPHLPQAQEEMDDLTDAFLEARYSQRPVESGRARQTQADWKEIKNALRALRRKRPGADGNS